VNGRTALIRLLFASAAAAVPIVGCGAPGAMHAALPPQSAAAQARLEPQTALDQSVAQAQFGAAAGGGFGTVVGAWVTPPPAAGKPGYYLIDGETVPGPPDDVPPAASRVLPSALTDAAAPAPAATPNCVTFAGYVPPPCTDTGEFRRVYSAPGYSFALAHLTLPASMPNMPSPGLNGDVGYVYMEGWSRNNPDAGNSEFGFQYSVAK
jgi:hypothetical protein